MWNGDTVIKRHKRLWDAAAALVASVDPSYPWTSVQFNRNFRGALHRDDKDAHHQVSGRALPRAAARSIRPAGTRYSAQRPSLAAATRWPPPLASTRGASSASTGR